MFLPSDLAAIPSAPLTQNTCCEVPKLRCNIVCCKALACHQYLYADDVYIFLSERPVALRQYLCSVKPRKHLRVPPTHGNHMVWQSNLSSSPTTPAGGGTLFRGPLRLIHIRPGQADKQEIAIFIYISHCRGALAAAQVFQSPSRDLAQYILLLALHTYRHMALASAALRACSSCACATAISLCLP